MKCCHKCNWQSHYFWSLPARLPDMAASSVDTWNSLRASSTSCSVANGCSFILANDSLIRMMASNCLKSNPIWLNQVTLYIVQLKYLACSMALLLVITFNALPIMAKDFDWSDNLTCLSKWTPLSHQNYSKSYQFKDVQINACDFHSLNKSGQEFTPWLLPNADILLQTCLSHEI